MVDVRGGKRGKARYQGGHSREFEIGLDGWLGRFTACSVTQNSCDTSLSGIWDGGYSFNSSSCGLRLNTVNLSSFSFFLKNPDFALASFLF